MAKKTLAQLDAELDTLDRQRLEVRERARQVMDARNRLLHEEKLDYWGLNEVQYRCAKERSRSASLPLHTCLNEARKVANQNMRDALTAEVQPVSLGVVAKGV